MRSSYLLFVMLLARIIFDLNKKWPHSTLVHPHNNRQNQVLALEILSNQQHLVQLGFHSHQQQLHQQQQQQDLAYLHQQAQRALVLEQVVQPEQALVQQQLVQVLISERHNQQLLLPQDLIYLNQQRQE